LGDCSPNLESRLSDGYKSLKMEANVFFSELYTWLFDKKRRKNAHTHIHKREQRLRADLREARKKVSK